jgi:hypothetical protein
MPDEAEDDVAELVADLAYEVAFGHGAEAAAKDQLRWALNKLIDARVEAALTARLGAK